MTDQFMDERSEIELVKKSNPVEQVLCLEKSEGSIAEIEQRSVS